MKRILKTLLYAILLVIVLAIGGATYIQFSALPTYKVEMPEKLKNLQVARDSAHVVRGERIAAMLCMKCHAGTDQKLVGKKVADIPKAFGEIYSYNITQDKAAGIGTWTDGELIYFLRTGIKRDGQYAPPYMPKFPLMSDEDIQSIVAWLRSDRPNVRAASEIQPKNQPSFLVKFLCRVAMKPLPLMGAIAEPDTNQPVVLGKYLSTGSLGCFQCHSRDFKTNNEIEPEKSVGFFGGGNPMLDMEGHIILSKNITFDPTHGIGNYSESQFIEVMRNLRRPDGSLLHYPMEPYNLLSKELKAIYAYLRTVPQIGAVK